MTIQELLQSIQGFDIEAQKKIFADNVAANKEAEAKKTSNIDALTQQILGQKTTDKWSGGFGVDNSAKAMAKLLADAGITDIRQFGKVDKYEPVEVVGYSLNGKTIQRPNENTYYEMVYEGDTENGPSFSRRDLTPQEIAQVKPSYGRVLGWGDAENPAEIIPVDQSKIIERDGKLVGVTGQTYGNKETGQEIVRGTGRWQRQGGDDLFSGTGEGDGNTGYRVQFSPDGTPVFYTTKGSSSDLDSIMPIVQLGLMATGAGGLLGNAILGAGANQIAAGALGGALLGGGTAALSGQDVLKGALLGGAGGALSGYLNPATGEISATPTEGSVPVSGNYNEITGQFVPDANGVLQSPLTDLSGTNIGSMSGYNYDPVSGNWTMPSGDVVGTLVTENPVTSGGDIMSNAGAMPPEVTPTTSGYYNEITGEFVPDVNGPLQGPLTDASGTNIDSMDGYFYDKTTDTWVTPDGQVYSPNTLEPVTTEPTPKPTETPKSPLTVSDAIRLAGIGATLAGGAKLASNAMGGDSGGYPIVPIPSDWTSPIKPTGVAEFTPLAPIDFGNKEMLQGTQWEKLLDPNYGKAPAMPSMPTNPSNMDFNQLMGILGNTRTSIPTQSVSINDVIAGIQSQYGQTPTGSMG